MPSNFDDIYGGTFFKAADLDGGSLSLTIEDVACEDLKQKDGDTRPKLVLSFVGEKRKLPLNKTNANAIANAFGKDWQNSWAGKQVTLCTVPTTFGDGIRVIAQKPKAKAAEFNDEIRI